jgi:uncharacterized protein YcfL
MVDIVEDLGIIKDTATLTFLRVIRNERAHNKTPSVTERRIMMNSVVLIANLYIDNIQLFDELFYEL